MEFTQYLIDSQSVIFKNKLCTCLCQIYNDLLLLNRINYTIWMF